MPAKAASGDGLVDSAERWINQGARRQRHIISHEPRHRFLTNINSSEHIGNLHRVQK
jgi:hypothetical protein